MSQHICVLFVRLEEGGGKVYTRLSSNMSSLLINSV